MSADQMRHEILLVVKANGYPTTGDLFFSLAFRTESELRAICRALHIDTGKEGA